MSYCRWGEESDVYVIDTGRGYLECMACAIDSTPTDIEGTAANQFILRSDAIKHLRLHLAWGHKVPPHALERLEGELGDIGNEVSEEAAYDG